MIKSFGETKRERILIGKIFMMLYTVTLLNELKDKKGDSDFKCNKIAADILSYNYIGRHSEAVEINREYVEKWKVAREEEVGPRKKAA